MESRKRKRSLAYYLTCLEARHPENLEAIDIRNRLDKLRQKMKAEKNFASSESIDEIVDYFKNSDSLGSMGLGFFIQNERNPTFSQPFTESLVGAYLREYVFRTSSLLSSDYPMARWGDYDKNIFCIVALSSEKAAIYSTNNDVDVFSYIPEQVRSRLINLYTLAKADTAYFHDCSFKEFVDEHLGWAKTVTNLDDQKKYIEQFVTNELSV